MSKVGSYTYYISEVNDGQEGVSYDGHTATVTIEVTDAGNGKLDVTYNGSKTYETPVFTNSYNAEGEAQLFAKKADGGNLGDRKFAFVLKNENGEAIQTVTNIGANQTATFNKFTYSDVSKVGSYTYYISEVKDGQEGVSYDGHTATITIDVTDAGNGKLDVTYNGSKTYVTPVFTNTYTAKGSVELGGKKILDGRYFMSGDKLTVAVYDGEVNEDETENIQPLESVDVDLTQYIGKSEAPFSVPAIEYDLEDVGGYGGNEKTFTYTVIEVANMAGTTKTVGRHVVAVTLKDNSEGKLIITGITIDGNTVAPEDLTQHLAGLTS